MKLVRFGKFGKEKPGVLDKKGRIRDLSGVIDDIDGEALSKKKLHKIAKVLKEGDLPVVEGEPRLGAPIAQPGNFIAVGANYYDHIAETHMAIPTEPVLFNKAPSCVCGPQDPILLPRGAQKLDWEVELAFVIGKEASYVEAADGLDYVAGFMLAHDVSEREFQMNRGGSWTKGKSGRNFGPLGPWLVTPDEIEDPHAMDLWLEVNGERMQTGNTAKMIFSIGQIVHYASQYMVLQPGDVISTGTPAGVGVGRKPPVYLKPGDVVRLGASGLGEQQAVVQQAILEEPSLS